LRIENLAGGADTMRHERKGVERNQTEWNIDGVAVTDMAATGTSTSRPRDVRDVHGLLAERV
jgi:hypothetical protein